MKFYREGGEGHLSLWIMLLLLTRPFIVKRLKPRKENNGYENTSKELKYTDKHYKTRRVAYRSINRADNKSRQSLNRFKAENA